MIPTREVMKLVVSGSTVPFGVVPPSVVEKAVEYLQCTTEEAKEAVEAFLAEEGYRRAVIKKQSFWQERNRPLCITGSYLNVLVKISNGAFTYGQLQDQLGDMSSNTLSQLLGWLEKQGSIQADEKRRYALCNHDFILVEEQDGTIIGRHVEVRDGNKNWLNDQPDLLWRIAGEAFPQPLAEVEVDVPVPVKISAPQPPAAPQPQPVPAPKEAEKVVAKVAPPLPRKMEPEFEEPYPDFKEVLQEEREVAHLVMDTGLVDSIDPNNDPPLPPDFQLPWPRRVRGLGRSRNFRYSRRPRSGSQEDR